PLRRPGGGGLAHGRTLRGSAGPFRVAAVVARGLPRGGAGRRAVPLLRRAPSLSPRPSAGHAVRPAPDLDARPTRARPDAPAAEPPRDHKRREPTRAGGGRAG